MNQLDRNTFAYLNDLVAGESLDNWYLKGLQAFQNQPIETEDDIVRLVALAYSWMPTIPSWNGELDWEKIKNELIGLRESRLEQRESLLNDLVPVVNNSIVGVSKVLHFINTDVCPIIDSNVVFGWRELFCKERARKGKQKNIVFLPKNFGSYGKNNEKERKRHIGLYIKYWDNMRKWQQECGDETKIRDIEIKLYQLGKIVRKKSKGE